MYGILLLLCSVVVLYYLVLWIPTEPRILSSVGFVSFVLGLFVGYFEGYFVGFLVCRRLLRPFIRQLFRWLLCSPSASLSAVGFFVGLFDGYFLASLFASPSVYLLVSSTVSLLASLASLLVSSGRRCIDNSFERFRWSRLIIR